MGEIGGVSHMKGGFLKEISMAFRDDVENGV
jgi:hypothetical protein